MANKNEQLQTLKEQVALGNRLLHHYGLGSYQGHVSARVPNTETMVIRGRPDVSLERVEPADLMVVDFDGNVMESSDEY
ncbi:MAG: class II aldolase/adducin family protein, partial [Dehalococcoidia bacterium]